MYILVDYGQVLLIKKYALSIYNFALGLTFAALSLHRFPKLSRDEGRKSSFEQPPYF